MPLEIVICLMIMKSLLAIHMKGMACLERHQIMLKPILGICECQLSAEWPEVRFLLIIFYQNSQFY